jgi:hypothetical protein
VWISTQVHIHFHILAHTPGIVFFIFLFRLCFLFFFSPLHLHPHSASQVQPRCPIADPKPSSLHRQ